VLSFEPQQRRQKVWAVRQARRLLIDHFDLIALQYGDVNELFGSLTAVLDNQKTWRDHLEHEAKRRQVARSAPYEKPLTIAPDTEMNGRAFDGGCKPCERLRRERQWPLELKGTLHCFRCNKGKGDAGYVAFLTPEAGPESCFNDRFNRDYVWYYGRGSP
jgi:hypothetical protein